MDWSIIFINFVYAIFGCTITLVFMAAGYWLFDKITPFNTHDELAKGNQAVGTVIAAIIVGLGIAVGLVIGMGLN
ncbi:DUF350 domain-containing protein [Reinekea sp. G2M2-21]|jgi:uncharacterized membrane protein YjfL (UPF0719 family)|uniref:DUF350 domain-containing protein n=1 Tax=Reinekea sp. G2M2-21 TaxID=2788942 RepID=UPI0018A987DD|nr:DUF350 domain-containing protein [Reinekea sp. G2M2-21]MDX1343203.1 DUF350 domain-containing protein [Reinekea sp.]MDX1473191.1 DUF350 domain-containing protein [Reinekea sp.]